MDQTSLQLGEHLERPAWWGLVGTM